MSKGRRGKKPNKMIVAARELEATIPGSKVQKLNDAIIEKLKLGPTDAALVAYVKAKGDRCFLCDARVAWDAITGQFCYGCKKLICDEHVGETAWGGHLPKDHDNEPEDEEFDDDE